MRLNRFTGVLSISVGAIMFAAGVLTGHASAAAPGVSADAAWWHDVQRDAKADVVHATIDAYETGWLRGSDAEGVRIIAALKSAVAANLVPTATITTVDAIVYKKSASGHYASYDLAPEFSKTFGAYEALMDDFYVRFPKASSATIGDIMTCLADVPVFSCDQVAKLETQ
jgi:hypothetical protein